MITNKIHIVFSDYSLPTQQVLVIIRCIPDVYISKTILILLEVLQLLQCPSPCIVLEAVAYDRNLLIIQNKIRKILFLLSIALVLSLLPMSWLVFVPVLYSAIVLNAMGLGSCFK